MRKDVSKTRYLKQFENLVYEGGSQLEFLDKGAKLLMEAVYSREIDGDVVHVGNWTLYGKRVDFLGIKYVVMTLKYETEKTYIMEYDETKHRAEVVGYDEYGGKIMDVVLEGYTPGFKPKKVISNIWPCPFSFLFLFIFSFCIQKF